MQSQIFARNPVCVFKYTASLFLLLLLLLLTGVFLLCLFRLHLLSLRRCTYCSSFSVQVACVASLPYTQTILGPGWYLIWPGSDLHALANLQTGIFWGGVEWGTAPQRIIFLELFY